MLSNPLYSPARPLPAWLWKLVVCVVIVRLLISPNFLNLFYNYTAAGGSPFFKFHPSTYLLAIAYLFSGVTGVQAVFGLTRPVQRSLLILGASAAYSLYMARPNMAAVVVDTLVFSVLLGDLVSRSTEGQRRALCGFVVGFLVLHLLLVGAEFARKEAFIGRASQDELFFRPQGLLDHPLSVGYLCLAAMAWVGQSSWPTAARFPALLALAIQIGLCGVRFPILLACAIVGQQLVAPGVPRTSGLMLSRLLAVGLFPVAGVLLMQSGAFERLIALGVGQDESSLSRIESFRLLEFLQGDLIWTGLPPDEVDLYLEIFKLPVIENSFALLAICSGLVPMICLGLHVANLLTYAVPRKVSFWLVLVGALAGSIVFSSKSQFVPIFTVLCMSSTLAARHKHLRANAGLTNFRLHQGAGRVFGDGYRNTLTAVRHI